MKNLPVIIPRAEHAISRQMLNQNALKTLYRLHDNGFKAYIVGGCVRDLLLGREPKDCDIVTDATPSQIKRLFRNCRLVGRRFRLAHLHFADEIIEVATFRANAADEVEVYLPEGAAAEEPVPPDIHQRKPSVVKSEDGMLLRDNLFGTPEEDAWRRDFTVNALCYSIADFSIIDYVGGAADLELGIIRSIGDPWERFTEDPVRMLRAVRFAALLGFKVEQGAWNAILELAETIGRASAPRLYEEVLKLFLSGEAATSFQLLRGSGLFTALFPGMASWLTEEYDGFPHVAAAKALAWVDEQNRAGDRISPALLLAVFFGEYCAEKGDQLRQQGIPPHQCLDRALAEFMTETAATVLIPNRVALQMREIFLLQRRFRKVPGRKPESVCARPGFSDALAYLQFTGTTDHDAVRAAAWWERMATSLPQQEKIVVAEEIKTGNQRKRRRKRKKKGSPRTDGEKVV